MRTLLFLMLFFALTQQMAGQRMIDKQSTIGQLLFKESEDGMFQLRDIFRNGAAAQAENPRLVAICLDITLGLFGMHRMYLGTELFVPIAYTFTIGGGCVLWLADLIVLITAKDIQPFINNPKMFMWTND